VCVFVFVCVVFGAFGVCVCLCLCVWCLVHVVCVCLCAWCLVHVVCVCVCGVWCMWCVCVFVCVVFGACGVCLCVCLFVWCLVHMVFVSVCVVFCACGVCVFVVFNIVDWFRHNFIKLLFLVTKKSPCRCNMSGRYMLVTTVLYKYSWFQTSALSWMLYAFFWVIPRRLIFICHMAYKIQTPGNYPKESIQCNKST